MNYEEQAVRYRRQLVHGIITHEEYEWKLLELHESAVGAVDRAAREVCGHPVQYHGCLACYEEAL